MPYYAIGPVSGGALTARQIRYGGIAADVQAPTGEQTLDVTAAIGNKNPQSFTGRVFTVPGGALNAIAPTSVAQHRITLFEIAQKAYRDILPHWQSLATAGSTPTRATARWVYHTTALLDIIASNSYRDGSNNIVSTNAENVIASWRSFIEDNDGTTTWYNVMEGNASAANLWSQFSIADNQVIYCDAIHAGQGTWRSPDGSTTVIHTNNGFPANFTTEKNTLRN